MNFTEKLDKLMAEKGITRGGLADRTKIPYNTIVGFYTKGYKNIKLSNLKKIADFFNVPLDILANDELSLEDRERDEEIETISEKYAALSSRGKELVDTMIDGILGLETPKTNTAKKIEFIREYTTPAAAGYASPAEGEDFNLIERDESVPSSADFAVKISGDSMEPYIKDGSRVYVSRTNELSDGDVGIFFVDGDMKCKQYCEDSFGNIYLLSINRKRSDADMEIKSSSGITVFCFGKVIMDKRVPLPVL